MTPLANEFTVDNYKKIIIEALANDYKFLTLAQYVEQKEKNQKVFLLRHDLDLKAPSLAPMLEVERECGVRSTVFVRTMTDEYNLYGYKVFPILKKAQEDGFEIGLHTSFIELSKILKIEPDEALSIELSSIRAYFDVSGIAPHRDVNYMYNSLPALEKNWPQIKNKYQLKYQAYDEHLFMDNLTYLNEGPNPHLAWRNGAPQHHILQGVSIYMLTHSHWWYQEHPFEH